MLQNTEVPDIILQTWGQILSKVFKCKYFSSFQMQILLFSLNANTFQKYFKYFFKYFKFYMLAYMNILNVKSIMHIKWRLKIVKHTK